MNDQHQPAPHDPLRLTAEETELLQRATRELVKAAAEQEPTSLEPYPLGRLNDYPLVGVFVTLRKNGELRGCIGNFAESLPLGNALERAAVGSVHHDPRFPAVVPDEVDDLEIAISLLHTRELLEGSAEQRRSQLIVGEHGLDIHFMGRKGLLLPNVAVDFQLDAGEFLRAVCRKAGLPEQSWEDPDAVLYRFSAIKL